MKRIGIAAGATALVFFTAFPFVWMALTAFKRPYEIFTTPPTLLPATFTLENVTRLFAETRFATYLANSVLVASATVILTLIVATPAAYGLTRFRWRGRELVAASVLFTYMFAPIMVIIPFYVLMRALELTNTRAGLVLAYSAFCLPFALWLLRSFFQSIPLELEEAALTDGANAWRRFVHITLPQLAGVLFVVVLLRSIWMFTKFDTPWLMIQGGGAEPYIRTLPIYTFQRTFAYYEAGRGSAMAVLMFLLLVAAAALYFHLWRREEHL